MNRHLITSFFISGLALVLLSSCSPQDANQFQALPFVITITPIAPINSAETLSRAAIAPTEETEATSVATTIEPTASPLPVTPTPAFTPTYIPYLATPTETMLPPLELPTEQPRAPAILAWTGEPTYPADSDPGLLFRMDYDPDVWAQTEGNFGDIVLANRQIEYCTISPWSGHGLPVDWKVAHDFRIIGSAAFDVNIVTAQEIVKFVSYTGGDGHVLTGFQVTFATESTACLQAAETVFGTLHSFLAFPTPTPEIPPSPMLP